MRFNFSNHNRIGVCCCWLDPLTSLSDFISLITDLCDQMLRLRERERNPWEIKDKTIPTSSEAVSTESSGRIHSSSVVRQAVPQRVTFDWRGECFTTRVMWATKNCALKGNFRLCWRRVIYTFSWNQFKKMQMKMKSLAHQWILCSEWVPSEWESKLLIKASQ